MRRIIKIVVALALCLALMLAAGCSSKQQQPTAPRPEGKLAIAGFSNPIHSWEVLAGYLEEEGKPVPDGTLPELNKVMTEVLAEHLVLDYVTPAAVKQCEDIVVFEQTSQPRLSAWRYWLNVAKCMQVDYLLVPQVTYWSEREGSEAGVTSPASVALEFFLIDVMNEKMTRARFEETQQSLMQNLLSAGKFASRGGKWITALELASEGIDVKLTELGL